MINLKYLDTQFKNKNTILAVDTDVILIKIFQKLSKWTLSLNLFLKTKLITNSGYFQNHNHQLNGISKSTATHSTLILDNTSVSTYNKNSKGPSIVNKGFKTFDNRIVYEKNYWKLQSSHDGYLSRYGVIHQRNLEFFSDKNILIGKEKLIKKNNFKTTNFEIRFHLLPNIKLTKLLDNKSVLIELENSGWRFFSKDGLIDVETGLYFGNKNRYRK